MAKKKGKKGKGKKKGGDKEDENVNILTEVDKTFYELQITDLNRKLARLRETNAELEQQNSALEQSYAKLDEDRSDVIAYLRRTLEEKQNEANELQQRLVAMQESQESTAAEHRKLIAEMENEYKMMREQLTSEIKLITGKLNALEEFRIQRENLMKRYEDQENRIEEQENRHKEELYNAEKKYIFGKDMVKKEMERRLLQLASDFQDATRIQLSATTHRMIRENISLNNTMDEVTALCTKYYNDIEKLKEKTRSHTIETELLEEEREKLFKNNKCQQEVIKQLREKYHEVCNELTRYKMVAKKVETTERKLCEKTNYVRKLVFKVRILEQHLHAAKCREANAEDVIQHAKKQMDTLKDIMYEAIYSIKCAMKLHDDPLKDEAEKVMARKNLLSNLLKLLQTGIRLQVTTLSVETVSSADATYARGDLGFVPKEYKEPPPLVLLTANTQTGESFEDIVQKKSESELEQMLEAQEEQQIFDQSVMYVTQSMDSFYQSSETELEGEGEVLEEEYPYMEEMEEIRSILGEGESTEYVPFQKGSDVPSKATRDHDSTSRRSSKSSHNGGATTD